MKKHHHFLSIDQLDVDDINKIYSYFKEFKQNRFSETLKNKIVACLFFEDSTRTRSSFEIAAKNMGAYVLNLDVGKSSVSKGETIIDTINNIAAMGAEYFVLRHKSSGIHNIVSPHINGRLLNGGDGCNEHPSQALLDYCTMTEHFGDLKGKTIAIVGDVVHSRVAKSNIKLLSKMGVKVKLVGPKSFIPQIQDNRFSIHDNLKEGLNGVDIVMMLRIQQERMEKKFIPSLSDYAKLYQLNHETLKLAKDNSIVLHPGPINRGVEISSELADDINRSFILKQAGNGVLARQAIYKFMEM